jgi:hypothetical protein
MHHSIIPHISGKRMSWILNTVSKYKPNITAHFRVWKCSIFFMNLRSSEQGTKNSNLLPHMQGFLFVTYLYFALASNADNGAER